MKRYLYFFFLYIFIFVITNRFIIYKSFYTYNYTFNIKQNKQNKENIIIYRLKCFLYKTLINFYKHSIFNLNL